MELKATTSEKEALDCSTISEKQNMNKISSDNETAQNIEVTFVGKMVIYDKGGMSDDVDDIFPIAPRDEINTKMVTTIHNRLGIINFNVTFSFL